MAQQNPITFIEVLNVIIAILYILFQDNCNKIFLFSW
jgi:hypothetical protein